MQNQPIYLDNCATTRIDPQVLSDMVFYFDEQYGNAASSSHAFGWEAQSAVENAVAEIAALVGASPRELVMTSGATESNNLALTGYARANQARGNHIITCQTEHKSVLDTCGMLEQEGFEVTYLPVGSDGRISLESLQAAIRPETLLVSLMLVNNETGAVQPWESIVEICRQHSVCLHVDATQAVGKIDINVQEMGFDLMSFSAHKMHGPKGIGALYMRRAARMQLLPIIHGGQHQRGMRSGTLAVPLIVGFGTACRLAGERLASASADLAALRDRLEQRILSALPNTVVHGDKNHRSPIVSNLGFPGVDGEALLVGLAGVAVSAGSACTSASGLPSYVLLAMGVPQELAKASLRMSVSHLTTVAEVESAADQIIAVVQSISTSANVLA